MSGLVAQQAGQMLVCHRLKKKSSSHVLPHLLIRSKVKKEIHGSVKITTE